MIRCGGGTRRYRESRLGKGLGLLPRSLKRWPPCLRRSGFAQAGLKLLQPVPLCPALDVLIARDLCSGIRSIFARDRGGSPKRLHRPNRFSVWLRELEGGGRVDLHVYGLDPGYPQRGPYEASEGIYPGRRRGKLGVGKVNAEFWPDLPHFFFARNRQRFFLSPPPCAIIMNGRYGRDRHRSSALVMRSFSVMGHRATCECGKKRCSHLPFEISQVIGL